MIIFIFTFTVILILILVIPKINESFQNIVLSPRLNKKNLCNLKKGQKKMTNMFREFDRICRKYNLKYWCTGGTLIGVVRHKGWIPWDGDIDVSMIDTDLLKLEKIINQELPKHMWYQSSKTDKYYKSKLAKIRDLSSCYIESKSKWHNGLQLDIFVYKKNKNKLIAPFNGKYDIRDFDYNQIFPLKNGLFDGIKVYIPNQTKKLCIEFWGNYPPNLIPVNKRYPHEGRIDPDKFCQHHSKRYPNLLGKRL